MESQSKAKRSKAIKFIALGSLLALSSTLTGCSKSPTLAQSDREKEKEENSHTSGGHFYGGHIGGGARTPVTSSARPAAGTASRGWFGGFHFSGS